MGRERVGRGVGWAEGSGTGARAMAWVGGAWEGEIGWAERSGTGVLGRGLFVFVFGKRVACGRGDSAETEWSRRS